MKITDIRSAVIEGALGGDQILVQVVADNGMAGYGETFPTYARQGKAIKELVHWLRDRLIGEDPLQIDRLLHKMFGAGRGVSIAGPLTMAIAGVEIALWDLAGKALGLPVYQLLGGKHRNEIRVYADFHGGETDDPDAFARKAQEVVAHGFTAVKMDLDLPRWSEFRGKEVPRTAERALRNSELNHFVRLVSAVREAIGDDVDLLVDCHNGYDTLSAKKIAYAMEPYSLLWLEEPVPPQNIDALAEITAATRTPICAGENLYTRFQFHELLQKRAVDIVEPDIQKTGGLLEGKRIADLAGTTYRLMAPHCVATPVGTMASVHLCASIENFLILEYHMIDVPWWQELVTATEPLVQDGYIKVPETPGLGVELDESEVRRRLRPGETYFGD